MDHHHRSLQDDRVTESYRSILKLVQNRVRYLVFGTGRVSMMHIARRVAATTTTGRCRLLL